VSKEDARIAFLRRASAPDIPALAFKLAYLIAFKYMNRSTGTAHPSQETLAKDLDASDRTVRRLLTMLEPLGLAIDPGDGRGNASTYLLETRTNEPSLEVPGKADMDDLFSPLKADADVHLSDTKADTTVHLSRPKGGHLASVKVDTGVLPTNIREPISKNRSSGSTPGTAPPATKVANRDIEIAFEEWWKIYPRKVAKGAARKAYASALKKATPEQINTGALRYAAERTGQDDKYTKHPATWLNAECWADEHGTTCKPNGNAAPPDDDFW
jgi:Helix-turn-helix domain